MFEQVNESVRVLAGFDLDRQQVKVSPYLLDWRGHRYRLKLMGLHHHTQRGDKHVHIFEFASDNTKFKVELDTETLIWTLVEAYYEH